MQAIQTIAAKCVSCSLCLKECAFLRANGTPGALSKGFLAATTHDDTSVFQCNLCGLCGAVCPQKLDCVTAFLSMRRLLQEGYAAQGKAPSTLNAHKAICRYEALGTSSLLSLYVLPEGCHTVFFPGCTLTASRSAVTLSTYKYLKSLESTMGVVLDCCTRPSHDLGRTDRFSQSFSQLIDSLQTQGITKIITACPSCYVTFKEHAPELTTISVYEILAANPPEIRLSRPERMTIHDTCITRFVTEIQDAVRSLVKHAGGDISEMNHSRSRAICCGEGAAAAGIAPEITSNWAKIRKNEMRGERVVTYCAGCSNSLAGKVAGSHILDLLFDRQRARHKRIKVVRAPFTYINRYLLKKQLRKTGVPARIFSRSGNRPSRLQPVISTTILSIRRALTRS